MKPSMVDVEIISDAAALAEAAARRFVLWAQTAVADRGRFCVALSGGVTPHSLYALLCQPPHAGQVDWRHVHLFWGDERCVPPDHADSNFRAVREALLDRELLPGENIHRIPGELLPQQAADTYEQDLRRFFGGGDLPRFDLILLGLGDDGHTASLFPASPALLETQRWAVPVEHTVPPLPLVPRVTLTLPVLNAAGQVLFLVSGAGKASILARVLRPPDSMMESLPAQRIHPLPGRVTWLVDRAAASALK